MREVIREVIRVVTVDGKEHKSEWEARHHLDNRISDQLSRHASEIVAIGSKYQDIKDYLLDHLDYFKSIQELREDLETVERVCRGDSNDY
jgi:archaellum component FlaC